MSARRSVPRTANRQVKTLPFGREPRAGAVAAERLRHRRDHADLAAAVAVAPPLRDLAAVRRIDRLDAERVVERRARSRAAGHDVVEPPAVRVADVHVLDEAERLAALFEERRHRHDLVVVDAALDHRVHLHRQAGGDCGVDAFEHPVDGEVDVVQRAERRVVERVEADGDALQAGVGERARLSGEQRGVRRQRQVDVERRELLDEALEVAADERLAAGDPDLAGAECDERAARRA